MTRTKDKLLASAETCFLTKGYNATTVDEICQGAGATKGAFFHYFRSKQEAALATVDRHSTQRFDAFLRGADRAADPRDRPLSYIEKMLHSATSVERPACLVASLTLEMSDVEDDVHVAVKAAFERWGNDITRLLQPVLRIGPDVPTAEALSDQVMVTFEGALVLARARRDTTVITRAMDLVKAQVEQYLQPAASRTTGVVHEAAQPADVN